MKPYSKGLNFITHEQLVKRAKKWLEKAHGNKFACGVVLTECTCWLPEIPDVIGFNADRSILIECKVSRADFKADKKKSCRQHIKQLGNLRYYLTLPHVACPEDIENGIFACEPANRATGFWCNVNELDTGCCRVLFVNNQGTLIEKGTGAIFTIKYDVSDDAPGGECRDLDIENVKVADEFENELTVNISSGKLN